jgi:DNA-binding XRE family transcriptional regulator
MKIETNWDGFVVVAFVRYCLGRKSYAPGIAFDFLRGHWNQIEPNDRTVILRDIREELSRHDRAAGTPEKLWNLPYAEEWRALADELEKQPRPAPQALGETGPVTRGKATHELRRLRRERGMTQGDLAHRARVCARTIYAIEAGQSPGHQHIRRRLLRALGMSFSPETSALVFGMKKP